MDKAERGRRLQHLEAMMGRRAREYDALSRRTDNFWATLNQVIGRLDGIDQLLKEAGKDVESDESPETVPDTPFPCVKHDFTMGVLTDAVCRKCGARWSPVTPYAKHWPAADAAPEGHSRSRSALARDIQIGWEVVNLGTVTERDVSGTLVTLWNAAGKEWEVRGTDILWYLQ